MLLKCYENAINLLLTCYWNAIKMSISELKSEHFISGSRKPIDQRQAAGEEAGLVDFSNWNRQISHGEAEKTNRPKAGGRGGEGRGQGRRQESSIFRTEIGRFRMGKHKNRQTKGRGQGRRQESSIFELKSADFVLGTAKNR